MNNNDNNTEKYHIIGAWATRNVLLIGAIVTYMTGHIEVSGALVTALICSFLFL